VVTNLRGDSLKIMERDVRLNIGIRPILFQY